MKTKQLIESMEECGYLDIFKGDEEFKLILTLLKKSIGEIQ